MRFAIGLFVLGWTLLSCGPKPVAPSPIIPTPTIANLKELRDYVSTADALPEDIEEKALAFMKTSQFPQDIADAFPMNSTSFERAGMVVSSSCKKADELLQRGKAAQAARFLSLAVATLSGTLDKYLQIMNAPIKGGTPKLVKANRAAGLFIMKSAAFSEIVDRLAALESRLPKSEVMAQTFESQREAERLNQDSVTMLQDLLKSHSYDQIVQKFGPNRIDLELPSLHKALSLIGG